MKHGKSIGSGSSIRAQMGLPAGIRLGPYEVESAIGAGGMGEVYRARDPRLDRTVAIKVLPSHIAGSGDLRERFEREARAISSLDHPHICALYDVGEHEGTAFLVMQYLDSDTLADRLKTGALPVDQALEIATQIADALDKAHRAGIVHRDLKPGNIMLTSAGTRFGARRERPRLPVCSAQHSRRALHCPAPRTGCPTSSRLSVMITAPISRTLAAISMALKKRRVRSVAQNCGHVRNRRSTTAVNSQG